MPDVKAREQLELMWTGAASKRWDTAVSAGWLDAMKASLGHDAARIASLMRPLFVRAFELGAQFEHERRQADHADPYRGAK